MTFLLWLVPFAFLFCGASTVSSQGHSLSGVPLYSGFKQINPVKTHIIIVGDTQRTSLWEFWRERNNRERNNRERKLILDEIARRDPAFVLPLGDLTVRGGSEKEWQDFDELNQALREEKIPYFPILGNHDLYGSNEKALENYFGRFPHLEQRRWYSFVWKNIGLIIVDSSFSNLSTDKIEEQTRWDLKEIERLDHEPGVDYVIVCCHEPPFTNSKVVKPNKKCKSCFADPFIRIRKPGLFFSGHNHSYERFQIGGKFFIVSGGGGGPRHKVMVDRAKVRYADLFAGPELRFFHFCEIEMREKTLVFKVMALGPYGNFSVSDSVAVAKTEGEPLR